jgi:hypothetical protein
MSTIRSSGYPARFEAARTSPLVAFTPLGGLVRCVANLSAWHASALVSATGSSRSSSSGGSAGSGSPLGSGTRLGLPGSCEPLLEGP